MVKVIETQNPETEASLAAALWLCQLRGLNGPLLLRLLARWQTAEGALRAPLSALRDEGLAPAIAARFMAAPRELPRVVESLRGLRRLGITALPIASAAYPERLLQLADPPAVIYIQGGWPLTGPVLLLLEQEPLPGDAAAARAELVASIATAAVVAVPEAQAAGDEGVRLVGLAAGVLRARSRLPHELLNRVSAGQTTLLSTSAPGAPVSAQAATAVLAALAALADVVIVHGDNLPPATSAALFVMQKTADLPRGVRTLGRGTAGLKALRKALGIHKVGERTAHQDRLF